MDMKKTKILSAFIIIFILNSCGGGSSAPFELILPSTSAISLNEDNPYTSTITGSTNYKSNIKYEILTSTINGTSELSTTGNYNYVPNQDFFGNDSFTIQLTAERLDNNNVKTGEVLIKTMPISITVNPINDPPVVTITDDLVNFSNIGLIRDDVINIKVNIVDVDNELSEINFYGQLPSESVNATLDITSDQQSLDLYVSNIQTAGLFNMSLCADDGMDVDPVSGNEVPPGSLAEEVRDDIPAQLSEGEYVVPADVVRYYGVKFFEDLRDQAKMGLADMEANGRIGGEPVPAGGPINDEELSEQEMSAIRQMMTGMAEGGALKDVPKGNTGLTKLPTGVRNKMGFKNRGGIINNGKSDYRKSGMFYKGDK